ncbi:hypothetical protein HY990_07090 [Candidatus Micrarchaeota archaeon]|nr:hypothetical protein [Candidatus Micrarchaeota archaeon]
MFKPGEPRIRAGRDAFGNLLYRRGLFEKAAEAFRCAGSEFEARADRIERNLQTLKDAHFLMDLKLHSRAARCLVDADLVEEAGEFARKIKYVNTKEGALSRAIVAIKKGDHGAAEAEAQETDICQDSHGHYIAAIVRTGYEPERAREKAEEFLGYGSVQENAEEIYYALKIFQKLNDLDRANQALIELEELSSKSAENKTFYCAGLLSVGGKEAIIQKKDQLMEGEFFVQTLVIVRLSTADIDTLILELERIYSPSEDEECIAAYTEAINCASEASGFECPLLGVNGLRALATARQIRVDRIENREEFTFKTIERILSGPRNLEKIREAADILQSIEDTRSERSQNAALKIAEAAATLEDLEAQELARTLFETIHRPSEALDCVRRMMKAGGSEELEDHFERLARQLEPQAEILAAREMYNRNKFITINLLLDAGENYEANQIARKIIESGTVEELEMLGYAIARGTSPLAGKHSQMLQEILRGLEEKGAANTAEEIRVTMRIPRIYAVQ